MRLGSIIRTTAHGALQTACYRASLQPVSTFAIAVRAINAYRVLAHKRRKASRAHALRTRRAPLTIEDLRLILRHRAIARAQRRADVATCAIAFGAGMVPILLAVVLS